MYKLIDLTKLDWKVTHNGGVSYGCFYKATDIVNGRKIYYKCSQYYGGQGVFGDESINEVICSRFLTKLGFDCLRYTLVYASVMIDGKVFNTFVSKSENFFVGYSSRITLEDLHSMGAISTNQLITNLGIQDSIRKMLIADFMILQRDRHGGNIELLYKDGKYTLSPLFDNGLGLLAPYPSSFSSNLVKVKSYDVMADYPVNNYIGERSLYSNLGLVTRKVRVNKLNKSDRSAVFYGMYDLLPRIYLDKIWELLWSRYNYLLERGYIYYD